MTSETIVELNDADELESVSEYDDIGSNPQLKKNCKLLKKRKLLNKKNKSLKHRRSDQKSSNKDYESYDEEVSEEDEDKSGFADAMAKILSGKNDVILSKAKKDCDIVGLKKCALNSESEVLVKEGSKVQEKKEKAVDVRVKPDILTNRQKEKKLKNIAVQGVVQLLNAIEKYNVALKKKLSEADIEVTREKALKAVGKDSFMTMLESEQRKSKKKLSKKEKSVEEWEEKPKWNAFSDNFYNDEKEESS